MKDFTDKDIQACLDAGFAKAWVSTTENFGSKAPQLIAITEDAAKEIVIEHAEKGVKARVLVGSLQMRTPKSITLPNGDGHSPISNFKSAKDAAIAALKNPLY